MFALPEWLYSEAVYNGEIPDPPLGILPHSRPIRDVTDPRLIELYYQCLVTRLRCRITGTLLRDPRIQLSPVDSVASGRSSPNMGPRPATEPVQIYSVQSVDYPLGFVRPQSPRQTTVAGPSSRGSAGAWDLLAGSYSHQPTSESHSPYNPGGFRDVRQQNTGPIDAAPPSQGPAGVQNAWVPISQVYLNFTFLRQPLPEDNWTTMAAKKRRALVVCDG
jgi:hypothetical protein